MASKQIEESIRPYGGRILKFRVGEILSGVWTISSCPILQSLHPLTLPRTTVTPQKATHPQSWLKVRRSNDGAKQNPFGCGV